MFHRGFCGSTTIGSSQPGSKPGETPHWARGQVPMSDAEVAALAMRHGSRASVLRGQRPGEVEQHLLILSSSLSRTLPELYLAMPCHLFRQNRHFHRESGARMGASWASPSAPPPPTPKADPTSTPQTDPIRLRSEAAGRAGGPQGVGSLAPGSAPRREGKSKPRGRGGGEFFSTPGCPG